MRPIQERHVNLPIVGKLGVAIVEPDEGVLLRLHHATTKEKYESRQWDIANYAIPLSLAIELSELLQKTISEIQSSRPKH